MARTKPSVAEAAAARREADAALEAARRQHLAALEIAAAAGRIVGQDKQKQHPQARMCRYGAACYRPDCLFKHPPRRIVAQPPACRDGWHCTRKDCGFTHPPGVHDTVELPSSCATCSWQRRRSRRTGDTARRAARPSPHRDRLPTRADGVDVKAMTASGPRARARVPRMGGVHPVRRGFQSG